MKLTIYLASLAAVLYSAIATASFQQPVRPAVNEQDSALERTVWNCTRQDLAETESNVVRQIQLHPTKSFYFYLLAHLKLRQFSEDPQDLALIRAASELAQQAVDLSPKADLGYVALAETLDIMGQASKGIGLLETASMSDVVPSWRYYFALARLHAQSSSQAKVLGLLKQAMNLTESETQTDIIAPYVTAVIQASSSGQDLLNELFKWDARFPNHLFKQAVAIELAQQGQNEKAHEIYQDIHTRTKNREAQLNDAILLYSKLDRTDEAQQLLQKIVSQEDLPDHDLDLAITAYSHYGSLLLKTQRPDQAAQNFTKAITLSGDKLGLIDFASKAYRKHGQSAHLADFIEGLTRHIKPSAVLFAILGETQSEDLAQHRLAVRSFSDAILLDPNRSDFYNGLGLTYYRMQDNAQALLYFKEATRIDPHDATAMYNGACVLSKMGRLEESLGALQEAVALDPQLAAHARTDKDFLNLLGRPEFDRLISSSDVENEGPGVDELEDDYITH